MRRTAFPRALSLLVALVVASAAHGLAITHGHAHRAVAQHERDHDAANALASTDVPGGPVVGADDHDDHAHPELAPAIGTRADAPLFVGTTGATIARPTVSIVAPVTFDEVRAVPRGPPLHALRQSRAPPRG